MNMQAGSASAANSVEKSAAVARRSSGKNADSCESGAPTFASVLTGVVPEANADSAANASASAKAASEDKRRDTESADSASVPSDVSGLLAQNQVRTAEMDGKSTSASADTPSDAAGSEELAALAGTNGQTEDAAGRGVAYHSPGHPSGKPPPHGAGKQAGIAAATYLAASTDSAQSFAAQHASTTQTLLRRADFDRASQEVGSLALGKGLQAQADEARLMADTAGSEGRMTIAAQSLDTSRAGPAMLDVLGFSRLAGNLRGGDKPAVRAPFAPAGASLAGSWVDHGMSSGSPAALTTYAPDATVAVPEAAVAEKLNYWISRGVQNAELQLDAFGGGTVKVSISVQGQDAQVEFRSDQPEARKLLQDAMPQLSAMLKGEGLSLSGGFVGSSAQQEPGTQQRRSSAPNMRAATISVEPEATNRTAALSRTPGRAVDLFV